MLEHLLERLGANAVVAPVPLPLTLKPPTPIRRSSDAIADAGYEPLERCRATAERSPLRAALPSFGTAGFVRWRERERDGDEHFEHHAAGVDAHGRLWERVAAHDGSTEGYEDIGAHTDRRFGEVRPAHWRSVDTRDGTAREHLALPDRFGHLLVLSRPSNGRGRWTPSDVTSRTFHAVHRTSRVVTTSYRHAGRRVRYLVAVDAKGRALEFAHDDITGGWSAAPVAQSSPNFRPLRVAPASLALWSRQHGEDTILHVAGVDARGRLVEVRRACAEHAPWRFTLVSPLAAPRILADGTRFHEDGDVEVLEARDVSGARVAFRRAAGPESAWRVA